jgi:hypothetical protein
MGNTYSYYMGYDVEVKDDDESTTVDKEIIIDCVDCTEYNEVIEHTPPTVINTDVEGDIYEKSKRKRKRNRKIPPPIIIEHDLPITTNNKIEHDLTITTNNKILSPINYIYNTKFTEKFSPIGSIPQWAINEYRKTPF